MSVLNSIKERFSVRSYARKDIDDSIIEHILEAARFSQSAKNLQDWRFIVVRNADTRQKLAAAARGQMFVAEAPVVIACCGIDTGYVMTNGQKSYPIDVAIAMENMALTAHDSGLGTCWLGAFYEDEVKRILNITPPDMRVVGLLTVGYPSVDAPPKRRISIQELVRMETWE